MTIRVLFFSILREKTGHAAVDAVLPSGATSAHLIDRLAAEYPAVAAYRSVVRLAVNEAYAVGAVELNDGDEVALITPVSGG